MTSVPQNEDAAFVLAGERSSGGSDHYRAVSIAEEAAPQTWRKIALNGWLVTDPEPADRPRVDQELEQSCVDALTLQLRHQTTDVYVPLSRGEFALTITRSIQGAAWLNGGLAPSQRPDLPFGNCWSSGVAVRVHVIDRGESETMDVHIMDEQGTLHRFVALHDSNGCIGYHPLPGAGHEQDGAAMSLRRDSEGNWIFRRKFGTTLVFSAREVVRETGREQHRFHPLASVADSDGLEIRHLFHDGNDGLIPDEITFHNLVIRIERGPNGCISRIVDPRGNDFLYHYRAASVPGCAPLLVAVERPLYGGNRPKVGYEYDEFAEMDAKRPGATAAFHTNLSQITDRKGFTHKFEYMLDCSRIETSGGVDHPAAGMERCVSRIDLPGGFGSSSFYNYSLLYADPARKSRRVTAVSDAVGNSRIYKFIDPAVISLTDLPTRGAGDAWRAPRLAVFRGLTVAYCSGNRNRLESRPGGDEVVPVWPTKQIGQESYHFDVEAGMALEAARDLSGNVTKFLHEEARVPKPGQWLDPTSLKHSDPTARINAMGAVRRYRYDPETRLLLECEDELGRVTRYTREPRFGAVLAEASYESRAALDRNEPFTLTEFQYSDPRFPALPTRKIIRKLPRPEPGPEWEADLVTDFELDELGRVACEARDPEGLRRCNRFRYDACGSKLSTQHPNGFFVQFRYDPIGQLIRIYHPREKPIRIDFDLSGNTICRVESNGERTVHEYDALNRETRSFSGPDAWTAIQRVAPLQYSALNFVTYNPLVDGQSRKLERDAMQRLVKTTYGGGAVVRYSYGQNCGSLLFKSSEMDSAGSHPRGGRGSRWKYDACCRKIEENILGRGTAKFEYDAVGNLIAEVDPKGVVTRYEYDALNRRVKTIRPNSNPELTFYTSTGLEYRTVLATGIISEKRYDCAGEPCDPQS